MTPAAESPDAVRTSSPAFAEPPAGGPDYAVGHRRPPVQHRFRPGVSGNPMGRPRRRPPGPAGGRAVPAEPGELERALALPVTCFAADASGPVSLARAVVARLTDRALNDGDVIACRELLRLCAEAELMAAEREALAAEAAEAAEEAGRAAEAEARRLTEEQAQDAGARARDTLEALAGQAAEDAAESEMLPHQRALKLLGAAEVGGGRLTAWAPWAAEAARAHDPRLPRRGDQRPLDPADPRDAFMRLDILADDGDGGDGLNAWFIDAARARRPDLALSLGDEALLQLVRLEPDEWEPDWAARLRAVEATAGEGSRSPDDGVCHGQARLSETDTC